MEPIEQHNGKFPGFSFFYKYPILRPEEAGKPETQMDTTKKNPNKTLFLTQRPGKG